MDKSDIRAPKVAEGYFFRVSRRGVADGYVRVELRKYFPEGVQDFLYGIGIQKKWSFRVHSRWAYAYDRENIQGAMEILWENQSRKLDSEIGYTGDYL